EIEWHRPAREPPSTEAVRLVRLLRFDSDEPAIVSVGDAEVLHTFLRDARRSSPSKIEERTALAALCRYLQSRDWMPPHLASQYGLRAKAIMPPETVEPKPEVAPREPPEALPPIEPSLLEVSMEPAAPEVPSEPALEELEDLELDEDMTLPEAQPVPPNPVPRPEPPLPLPQPEPAPGPVPEPEPEPGPGPEDAFVDPSQRAELEEERRSSRLREEAQAFVEEGDYAAALECYDRLLRSRPEETSVWFDRAELLVLLDRPEEALQAYTRILDVDRGNRQASYERANLLFGLGRLSVAIDALREALRLDPSKSRDVV